MTAEICPGCGARQQTPDNSDFVGSGERLSREQIVAGILAITLGALGIHKFYLGYTAAGVVMLVVSIVTIPLLFLGMLVMTVIGVVEGVLYLTKSEEQFRRKYIRGRKAWF